LRPVGGADTVLRMHLAARALSISGSATLELTAKIAELRRQGVDVVSLGAGEPDFPTHPAAIAAAQAFIGKGRVLYTPATGLPELREAAAAELTRETGVRYEPRQVCITNGAKEGLALAILAVAQDPGDEVILPTPCWVSYESMVTIAGAKLVRVPCTPESGFKLAPEALARAITPRTRALLLNSPNNPTGAITTREELAALCEVLRGRDITVISDEIYSPFVFEGEHVSPASLPGMAERTVVVNGVSKSYSMTGWRLGWTGAPQPLADAIANLKSHLTSNAAAPSQVAALAALRDGRAYPEQMKAAFRKRLALAVEALGRLPGISLARPGGAFYVFPRVDALYGPSLRDSDAFCAQLLDSQRVAALAGSCFGDHRCVRFSIATSDDQLREGLARITRFVQSLAGAAARR
jgi:aspartate aminotransferase